MSSAPGRAVSHAAAMIKRKSGLSMTAPVFRSPFLIELFIVVIVKVVFIYKNNILLSSNEVAPTAVFTLLVHKLGDAQKLSHLVLVVNEISPFHARLEHHLHAVARCRDIHHLDANLLQVEMRRHLLPPQSHVLGVMALHHVVEINHGQSIQPESLLLAPATPLGFLLGFARLLRGLRPCLVEVADEDDQGQRQLDAVGPCQGLFLGRFPLQGLPLLPLLLLQILLPVLKVLFLRPVPLVGGSLDLTDLSHHPRRVMVSQEGEHQLMADILRR